ncbi:MAG: N-6 DNA methylase, partial [Candidatus Micrarchaeota archaeon]|nr:N-6 DNA methylase [Candidatus Micrarchaeota archaeon]
MKKRFQEYLNNVRRIYLTNDYTEQSYRTAFQNFIERLDGNFSLIQESKKEKEIGTPDFKAFYKVRKIGFIETKDVDKNLDKILESEQLRKYVEGINNLILTNYYRFMLIRSGQKIFDFNLFDLTDLNNKGFIISDDKIEKFIQLITEFFNYKLPTISSAEELARELSKKAKLLNDFAKKQLEKDLKKIENGESPSTIYDFYGGMKEMIKEISIEDCADTYAQTVTYGLFLARKNCEKLDRRSAASYIPKSIGIIKRMFINISGDAFPSNISWIIDDIVDILNTAKINEILAKIDKRGKKDKDPIIFFYEDFLNFYEPEKRKHMGVYYTPRPVVNFIVNSINLILKRDFGKHMGFVEDDVHVLDPAIGTGTFFWITFLL